MPITIHTISTYLAKVLVSARNLYENNSLNPNYQFIKSVIARLQERTGRISFKTVEHNPVQCPRNQQSILTTVDTDTDLVFMSPGMLLKCGSQCLFTKVVKSLNNSSYRKGTMTNLDRIRCCISDEFGFMPSDKATWTSIRSANIHRLSRNFLWKCIHNIFRVGSF